MLLHGIISREAKKKNLCATKEKPQKNQMLFFAKTAKTHITPLFSLQL